MTTKNEPLQSDSQDSATHDGMVAELSDEAIRNLAGFFDVLIQMDFAQKLRNERSYEDGNDRQNNSSIAA